MKIKNLQDSVIELKQSKERDTSLYEQSLRESKEKYEELLNTYENTKRQNEESLKQVESKILLSKSNETQEKIDDIKKYYEQVISNIKSTQSREIQILKEELSLLSNKTIESTKHSNRVDIEKDFLIEELKNDKNDLEGHIIKLTREKKLINESLNLS